MRALLQRYHRILNESAWVFAGQGASALATLFGLRLITQMVPPAVYGSVTLALGVVSLLQGLAVGPLMQAVLRFYPEFAHGGQTQELHRAALHALRKPISLASGALVIIGLAWIITHPHDAWLVIFSLALFMAEVARALQVTFLNAARNQRTMSLFTVTDAWLRPIMAVSLIWQFGVTSTAVVAGYLAGCLLTLFIFSFFRRTVLLRDIAVSTIEIEIMRRLQVYSLPLTILPLVGWVSGQADRYLLGGMTGIEAAGLYSALYGLASKPFLIFTSSVELALRQPYYASVSANDHAGERKALAGWLAVVLAGALALCLMFVFFHAEIATLLLATGYRANSVLMAWIATGYVLFAAAQVLMRVCYAHHDTRGVLWVETVTATMSLIVAAPLIYYHGIIGAAWSVPIYFALQLFLVAARARNVRRFNSMTTDSITSHDEVTI